MDERRRPGLLGYFTLALMTTAVVVCVLVMVILRESSLGLMLGTIPALLVIDWLSHRVELKMGEYLPKRLWDLLVRGVLWAAAVLVMWARYRYADPKTVGFTPDFALLMLVVVQALTLQLRVIHAMGRVKDGPGSRRERAPEPELEPVPGPGPEGPEPPEFPPEQ